VRGIDVETKKADVPELPEAFQHVGLLIDKPPGFAGLPFIQSSEFDSVILGCKARKSSEFDSALRMVSLLFQQCLVVK
jgi:hypothetical protein